VLIGIKILVTFLQHVTGEKIIIITLPPVTAVEAATTTNSSNNNNDKNKTKTKLTNRILLGSMIGL
jgi:hypothetical protein